MATVTLYAPSSMVNLGTTAPVVNLGDTDGQAVSGNSAATFYGVNLGAGAFQVSKAFFDTLDLLGTPNFIVSGITNVTYTSQTLTELLVFTLSGNDLIVGSSGVDVLYSGQSGNDTFVVTAGDTILPTTTGTVTVQSSTINVDLAVYTSGDNIKLTGAMALSAKGDNSGNLIDGASNAAGNSLRGLAGNDTYVVGSGDHIFEAAGAAGGTDIAQSALISLSLASYANVENAQLLGAAALNVTGNSGINSLTGNTGNNVMAGGLGNDVLRGGAGKDVFVFNTALNPTTNRDSIADFIAVNDTIRLENAVFTGLGTATGILTAGKFWASATGLAHDADDRIIYNTATGILTYDSNGRAAGGALAFATLATKPAITAADFVVI